MLLLTLPDIKRHLRVETDQEDELLTEYGEAAEQLVLDYLNREVSDIVDEYRGIPRPIKQAALILVGDFYAYREAGRPGTVSAAIDGVGYLLIRYKRL